jgi:NDP-sugar pyrophosphorylase family protein
MKAMIFAAGLGTRLKPLTDTMPKALVPVCGQPLLYHVLTKLVASGYDDIVVNVHHFPDQIIDFLRSHDFGVRIAVSDERDFLRETGGGIRFAQGLLTDFSTPPSAPLEMTKGTPSSSPLEMTKGASSSSQLGMTGVTAPSATLGMSSLELRRQDEEGEPCQSGEGGAASRLGGGPLSFRPSEASGEICPSQEPFLVHNVDIISNLDLRWLREQHRPEALATLVVSERKTQRYFLFDEDNRLRGWTNLATGEVRSPFPDIDPAKCRKLAFAGIHLISPEIFPAFGQFGFGDRFSIVDFYLKACAEYPIYGVVPNDFRMVDVGKKETLSEAERVCEAILR